jgi:Ca-activated chloride channel homolog
VRGILLGGLVFLLASIQHALSQTSISVSNAEGHFFAPVTTISKTVNEVDLAFTVTDKRGHFVGNLRPDDFALLDNKTAPARLTLFQQRTDLPLHLAVLIDASDSVKCRFKFEQQAALSFIRKILRPGVDSAFVVAFNDQVKTVQELTGKRAKVSKALKNATADGNTALYDALIYASDKLRQIPEHQLTRRGIILLSDGMDTVHRSTLEQAKEAVARAQTTVFSVSTNLAIGDDDPEGDPILKDLAQSTGGIFLSGDDDEHVQSAFNDVRRALHNQYVIAYHPDAFQADGSYHTIEVLPHKHGLRANCRKGYYAMVRAIR